METQRPQSETYREGSRSLRVLCAPVVQFMPIRVHLRPFAVPVFYLRSSAVDLFVAPGRS
jgi:hypothetical protein